MPEVNNDFQLAETEELLLSGGDARISLDKFSGRNKYACTPRPEPEVAAFGSSTASSISLSGFQAAEQLRCRVQAEISRRSAPSVYAQELNRIRIELTGLCGLDDLNGLVTIFSSSGTDAHLIATQLIADEGTLPLLVIMMAGDETGKGVPAALNGCHFSSRSALGATYVEGEPLKNAKARVVVPVPIRTVDGKPRRAELIHQEVETLTAAAAHRGQRVLLILLDQSKTGLIAPSPAYARSLQDHFPDTLDILIDACQFRLASSTLRDYLDQGFMVAVTGSKFLTGPAFSGALFIPGELANRLNSSSLPDALSAYSTRADWPENWRAADHLDNVTNFGLLLRWEAALAELRAFCKIPQADIRKFLGEFATTVQSCLTADPHFEPLSSPEIERGSHIDPAGWDSLPTIFPFLLCRPTGNYRGIPLSYDATMEIYRQLQHDLGASAFPFVPESATLLCQVGQPVLCGIRDGIPLHALRICSSSRLVAEAASAGSSTAILKRFSATLDKTAWLVANCS